MAGALDWLMNLVHGQQQGPITGADGTTYGPAVSRVTHTPITFTTSAMPAEQMGAYIPPGGLLSILGLIPQLHREGEGQIQINPNSPSYGSPGFPASVSDVLRHEQSHAAMDKLGYNQQRVIANTPGYQNLAPRIAQTTVGNPKMEVGAYALTQPPGSIPTIPASDQTSYADRLLGNINSISPAIAQQLARLRSR